MNFVKILFYYGLILLVDFINDIQRKIRKKLTLKSNFSDIKYMKSIVNGEKNILSGGNYDTKMYEIEKTLKESLSDEEISIKIQYDSSTKIDDLREAAEKNLYIRREKC